MGHASFSGDFTRFAKGLPDLEVGRVSLWTATYFSALGFQNPRWQLQAKGLPLGARREYFATLKRAVRSPISLLKPCKRLS